MKTLKTTAWNGQRYRRAYFDDGTPLGSSTNPECQIDSIPQSWSIISHAGDPERARRAMAAVEQRLVRLDAKAIQLFDPPFDKSTLNPGYIKGYIPRCTREWRSVHARGDLGRDGFRSMGENDRAWDLFDLICPCRSWSYRRPNRYL